MNPRAFIATRCVALVILAGILPSPGAAAVSPFANPPSSYLLQINGEVYRAKSPHLRRAPASLTKIMTALIALEDYPLDQVVKVSAGAARESGSRIGLRRGDRLTVRDLVAAALIASANDAARALADHADGSQKVFVTRMNERAKRLKLTDTHFANAAGHDHRGLYTSASDLALLAEHALKNPVFADLVSRGGMRIATVEGKRTFWLRNKNRLIGRYPGARGVKTGTTPKAGQCLVALAQRDDTRVLLVMMNSRSRWRTAPAMLDAAFASCSTGRKSHDKKD